MFIIIIASALQHEVILLLLPMVYFLFLSSFFCYSTFPPKFEPANSPSKQVRSLWNFTTMCRMVSIVARAFLLGNITEDKRIQQQQCTK